MRLPDRRPAVVTNRHMVDPAWADPSKDETVLECLGLISWRRPTTTQWFVLRGDAVVVHPDPAIEIVAAILCLDSRSNMPWSGVM